MRSTTRWSVVVMAKAAVPGRVKTRLTRPADGRPGLSAEAAAAVHSAMLDCVLKRAQTWLSADRPGVNGASEAEAAASWQGGPAPRRWVLAMDDPTRPPAGAVAAGWEVVGQGEGDLGDRLDHVWQRERERATGDEQAANSVHGPGTGGGHGVVFFGVDCPDVPGEALRQILATMEGPDDSPTADGSVEAVVGPVSDGGYWTLGCRGYRPQLIRGIDWGGPGVYDQTRRAAWAAGVELRSLPAWHDVDEPADLEALRQRLIDAQEPALRELRDALPALRA